MSQTETPNERDADVEEEKPEIEEDLVGEELRIDGICGVY
ncbi:mycofactocin precursor [Halobacteriales archaeon QH_2_65_14]|jgi:mycofactocin precursor|nr:MAG: mycofactocin precursor [Halobacteriales archaeon QH_2_65_14]